MSQQNEQKISHDRCECLCVVPWLECIDSFSTSEINMHLEHWTLHIEHWKQFFRFVLPFLPMYPFGPFERPFKTYKYSKWVDISNKYMREFQFKFYSSFFAYYVHFPWYHGWLAGWLIGWLNAIKSYSLRVSFSIFSQ